LFVLFVIVVAHDLRLPGIGHPRFAAYNSYLDKGSWDNMPCYVIIIPSIFCRTNINISFFLYVLSVFLLTNYLGSLSSGQSA